MSQNRTFTDYEFYVPFVYFEANLEMAIASYRDWQAFALGFFDDDSERAEAARLQYWESLLKAQDWLDLVMDHESTQIGKSYNKTASLIARQFSAFIFEARSNPKNFPTIMSSYEALRKDFRQARS